MQRPRRACYNGPDHTWASMLDDAARWDDLVTGLRPMSYGAKGVLARCLVSVGPTTTAKASSEGWRLHLRPNIRRLRRRLPREPVPLLPPTAPLQGVPSPYPLVSPGLFRVLLLLLLLRGDPSCGSVHRVLRDRWQGGLVKPQLLETNGNPDGENQRQPDTR
jgi:hypothetical protein